MTLFRKAMAISRLKHTADEMNIQKQVIRFLSVLHISENIPFVFWIFMEQYFPV